jgi:hypothetical protein
MVFVQLKKSQIDGKKYTAIFYDEERNKIKTTHFGQAGANDFTSHGEDADERKKLYLERHRRNENWADYQSAGSLSKHILWNKSTLTASYNDYLRKFKLKKY